MVMIWVSKKIGSAFSLNHLNLEGRYKNEIRNTRIIDGDSIDIDVSNCYTFDNLSGEKN